jgi:hypothetical protein
MTREELKAHCLGQIEMCKTWAIGKGEEPSGKIYEEHKLILELLEQEPRWISVSEDAPPKETICLWCNKQGSVFTSAITYRSENNSYVGKHGYFSNGLENHGDIVAWMPLPLPYEPQESEG